MSVGADKAYDTQDFVQTVREMNIRPHVSQNLNRAGGSAIDGRTTRHESYLMSQRKRPLVEKAFGWMKQTGGIHTGRQDQLHRLTGERLQIGPGVDLARLKQTGRRSEQLSREQLALFATELGITLPETEDSADDHDQDPPAGAAPSDSSTSRGRKPLPRHLK